MSNQYRDYKHGRDLSALVFCQPSVNRLVTEIVNHCDQHGLRAPSRNGDCVSLEDATLILTDPTNRHINLPWRKSNIFQIVAETLWVLAGEENINPYLSFFLPRAANYSDDGIKWHDAYGPRMIDAEYGGQLQDALELLLANPHERRAMVSIYDPNKDSKSAMEERGIKEPKGIPCNNAMWFWIREGKLKAKVAQRSGDIFYGTGSINLFEFTFIQELMLLLYNANAGQQAQVELGEYRHNVINLHFYDNEVIKPQVHQAAYERGRERNPVHYSDDKNLSLTLPEGAKSWACISLFCSGLVAQLTKLIQADAFQLIALAHDNLDYADINLQGVWREYFKALVCYIVAQRLRKMEDPVDEPIALDVDAFYKVDGNLAPEWSFHRAVISSVFRNFDVNLKV